MSTTATTAIAPIERPIALYDTPGVDLLGYPIDGEEAHVSWHEFDGSYADFDADAAAAILSAQGYERTGPWNYDLEYATAPVQRRA